MSSHAQPSLDRVAFSATVHCLTGCGFWAALAAALLITGVVAYPASRWLISRGKGHAVVHEHHPH